MKLNLDLAACCECLKNTERIRNSLFTIGNRSKETIAHVVPKSLIMENTNNIAADTVPENNNT